MVLGQLGIHMQKSGVGLLFHTVHNNCLKMIQDLTKRAKTIKLLEKGTGVKYS